MKSCSSIKMLFCMSFLIEFNRRFKKDSTNLILNAVPLSRDITSLNNEWLNREVTEDKVT